MARQLHLHITDPAGERNLSLDGGVVPVGRGIPAGVDLADSFVSTQHGRFEARPDGWYYVDLNSRNGSRYNGQPLTPGMPVPLQRGDLLQIGGAHARVIDITGAVPPPPPAPAAPRFGGPTGDMPVRPPQQNGGPPASVDRRRLIRVGRAIDNDIMVANAYVSSYHLEAWPHRDGLMVRDLGSKNGTFVNGQRITELLLAPGQVLHLGPDAPLAVADILRRAATGPEQSLYVRQPSSLDPLIAGKGLCRIVDKGRKTILSSIDVTVRAGQFIGIVGGSGAGKSTLMKVLNRYTPPERGTLLFARNAQGEDEEIGYVPQDDIIHRELPLRDALVLSAMLRYPSGTARSTVEARADEVLRDLGLSEHTKTVVNRLSGGQRKRASVALELMRRPRILVLDEPTSGLDPASGRRLIALLRALANQGVGILLVTHAMENLDEVDTLCFLAPGGNLVFWGSPEHAMEHFGTRDLAHVFNLLDPDGPSEVKRRAVDGWRVRFEESRYYTALQNEVQASMRRLEQRTAGQPATKARRTSLSWQLRWLAARYFRLVAADRRTLAFLVGQVPIIMLVLLAVFHRDALTRPAAGSDKYAEVFGPLPPDCVRFADDPVNYRGVPPEGCDRNADPRRGVFLLFVSAALMVWCGTFGAAREICKEANIWEREAKVGVRSAPYVLSKVLVLGLVCLVQAAAMTASWLALFELPYSQAGLAGIILIAFLATLSGVALGLLVSAASPTSERAMALLIPAMIPQLVFGGGMLPIRELGRAGIVSWVVSASWAYRAFGALTDRLAYLPRYVPLKNGMPFPEDAAVRLQRPLDATYEQFDLAWATCAGMLAALTLIMIIGATIAVSRRKSSA